MSLRSPQSLDKLELAKPELHKIKIVRLQARDSHDLQPRILPTENLSNPATHRSSRFDVASAADHKTRSRPVCLVVLHEDPAESRSMAECLTKHGMSATPASDRHDVIDQLVNREVDLVVLDLSIARKDGFALLFEIQSQFGIPLIVTAASHIGENDRAVALELGADDCMPMPMALRELLARIRAIIRRSNRTFIDPSSGALPDGSKPRRCQFGGWRVDRRARTLTSPDGTNVRMTKGEYALLAAFIDAPMVALSRERLLQATRIQEDLCDRSIDVQILRLRRKLNHDSTAPCIIRTIRGAGYMFMLPVENVG
jgi:two-component system, OmpR family, response regulator